MDETFANVIGLCEKYQSHKTNGIKKRKEKSEKELAMEAFGLSGEDKDGK